MTGGTSIPAPVVTGAPPGGRPHRWRRPVLVAVGLAAAALAAKVLYDSSDEVLAAADTLTHPRWGWVALALLAELGSYLLRGGAESALLRRGVASSRLRAGVEAAPPGARGAGRGTPGACGAERGTPGLVVLSAGSLAGDAAAYCLPLGFAASGAVMLGVLRRRGVHPTVAGWMYAVNTVLYIASVAAITVLAVQVAGNTDPVPGLWQMSLGLLALLVLLGVGFVAVRRARRAGRRGASASRDDAHRVEQLSGPRGWLRTRRAELRVIRLPARTGAAAFALLTGSWFCSIAVLGIAYLAIGATPPWSGLLVAFCAGQIAAAVPITPGGIGVVEGSLTLALVAFGGAQTATLAAVLLYRLVTYWACIPLGGLAWLALRASGRPAVASEGERR